MPTYPPITCPNPDCKYTFTPRVPQPKKCPRCQHWIFKPPPGR